MSSQDADGNIELFEKESTELFLDLIKERSCIWDLSDSSHNKQFVVENAMEEIAYILQDTVENCEKKWVNLKAKYHAERSMQQKESLSGAAASTRRLWPYYQQMHSFMNSKRPSVRSFTNISMPEENASSEPSKKKKKQIINPIESAINNVNASVNKFMNEIMLEQSSSPENEDIDAAVGKVILLRLQQLSPKSAKTKRKELMRLLCENSSDSE